MLTPLQLRLCGLSAMAPALTEAASQAQSFKLPYNCTTPATVETAEVSCGTNTIVSFGNVVTAEPECNIGLGLLATPPNKRQVILAATTNATNNKGHQYLTSVYRQVKLTTSLVDVSSGNSVFDSCFLTKKSLNNQQQLGKIGIASDLCLQEKQEQHEEQEGDRAAEEHSAPPYTMNNSSNTNQHSGLALDTMGMLKTTSNLKFAATNNNKMNIKREDAQCPLAAATRSPPRRRTDNECSSTLLACSRDDEIFESGAKLPSRLSTVTTASKEIISKNRIVELCARQANLERRAECLRRRIQKLQARQIEKHVGDQLSAFVDYQQKALQIPSKREKLLLGAVGNGGSSSSSSSSSSADIKAEILQSEDVKSLSTAALVNLVRKLESSHGSALRQKYATLQQIRAAEAKGESLGSAVSGNLGSITSSAIKFPKEVSNEMLRVSGTLQSNVRHLESAVDSDATASSSGGESCDEMDGYDEKKVHPTPILKRAAWKWAVDRASVASRWTWLQAQVSDLEYRIRQQSEIYRQLRATKGPIVLTDAAVPSKDDSVVGSGPTRTTVSSPVPSRLGLSAASLLTPIANPLQDATSRLAAQTGCGDNNYGDVMKSPLLNNSGRGPQVNGYINNASSASSSDGRGRMQGDAAPSSDIVTPPNSDVINGVPDSAIDWTCTASRTRPLKSFRKRKLLRTIGLHHMSRKAAKLSNVRCGCLPPGTPCIMCGGRINNTQSVDPDTMSNEERIGLLDGCYHSVLSLEQDIPLSVHFEFLMKNGEWQKTTQKPKQMGTARKKSRLAPSGNDVHKHSRKLKKNATATLTAKLKRKLSENKRNRGRGSSLSGGLGSREGSTDRMRKKQLFSAALKKQRERSLSGSSNSSSKPGSPTPSQDTNSCHFGGPGDHKDSSRRSLVVHDATRRRRGESAFDINNIVIPYSMAASTRVERLQYKEILTPKWRCIDDDEDPKPDEEEPPPPVPAPNNNGLVTCKTPKPEEDVMPYDEDVSDEAVAVRHDRCEMQEKKRFMSYVQTNYPTRGRSRNVRSDSRADSSGANTPDPMSPYLMEHQDSPLTTPPSTPAPSMLVVDDNSSHGPSSIGVGTGGGSSMAAAAAAARRRTTSLSKKENRLFDDFRSNTPEVEEDPIMPWDLRTFPLCDEDYDEMLRQSILTPPPLDTDDTNQQQPSSGGVVTAAEETPPIVAVTSPMLGSPTKPTSAATSAGVVVAAGGVSLVGSSRPHSPASSSSTSVVGEDPNDPEWTVSTMSAEKGPRPGIVIKLAKR